ncbi:MAG: hypothetical protein ACD_71C00057G0008, partial [uncultured bacterium (gcode 4)]
MKHSYNSIKNIWQIINFFYYKN